MYTFSKQTNYDNLSIILKTPINMYVFLPNTTDFVPHNRINISAGYLT